jgi:hypothetical protein
MLARALVRVHEAHLLALAIGKNLLVALWQRFRNI